MIKFKGEKENKICKEIYPILSDKKQNTLQQWIIREMNMSIEFRDGTFSENMPLDKALEKFQDYFIQQEKEMMRHTEGKIPKALHVGTEEELNDMKDKRSSFTPVDARDCQRQIDELREKIESMEKPKSSLIHTPTDEEIRQVVKQTIENNRTAAKNLANC